MMSGCFFVLAFGAVLCVVVLSELAAFLHLAFDCLELLCDVDSGETAFVAAPIDFCVDGASEGIELVSDVFEEPELLDGFGGDVGPEGESSIVAELHCFGGLGDFEATGFATCFDTAEDGFALRVA